MRYPSSGITYLGVKLGHRKGKQFETLGSRQLRLISSLLFGRKVIHDKTDVNRQFSWTLWFSGLASSAPHPLANDALQSIQDKHSLRKYAHNLTCLWKYTHKNSKLPSPPGVTATRWFTLISKTAHQLSNDTNRKQLKIAIVGVGVPGLKNEIIEGFYVT